MGIPGVKAPIIETRLSNQAGRIVQGVRSGDLTVAEARELGAQQKALYQDLFEARASNGFLNRTERADLRQQLRVSSQDIFEAKHNSVER